MKNISYLTLAFFTLLLFTECKKEEITDDVQFLTNSYFGDCFFYSASKSDEIVLRDQEEYESYFAALRQSSYNMDCSEAMPTAIDFDKYTLIGHWTSDAGCLWSMIVHWSKKETKKSLTILQSRIPDYV